VLNSIRKFNENKPGNNAIELKKKWKFKTKLTNTNFYYFSEIFTSDLKGESREVKLFSQKNLPISMFVRIVLN